jgi:maltooligosyltrehalose trehalohydrolase
LRRTHAAFRPVSRDTWQVEALPCGLGALRYRDPAGDWLILFDLVGGHSGSLGEYPICAPATGAAWQTVLSSNEAQFGGSGETAVQAREMYAGFERAELVVLREVGAG